MGGPAYTPEEIEAMHRMASSGRYFKVAVAAEPSLAHRDIRAVREQMRRMGLRCGKKDDWCSKHDAPAIEALTDRGPMSAMQLSVAIGCSRSTVPHIVRRLGLRIVRWRDARTPVYGFGEHDARQPAPMTNAEIMRRKRARRPKPDIAASWITTRVAA